METPEEGQKLWGDVCLDSEGRERRFCHSHQHLPLTKPAGRQLTLDPKRFGFPEPAPCLTRQSRGMAGNRSEHISIRPTETDLKKNKTDIEHSILNKSSSVRAT